MLIDPEKLTLVYWYCAIIGTVIFILKTALPIDSGTEIDTSFTEMVDNDSSFSLFTIESISAFFMCAGWLGWYSFAKLAYELKLSLIVAAISGVLGMLLFSFLIAKFKKLEKVNKIDYKTLEGQKGRAYMNFAPKCASKIEIEFNSKLSILDAINDTDEEICSFEPIQVIRVEKDSIYIRKGE